jgi:hypothetical protein
VIKFVSYLRQVGVFLRGTPVSSTNKTDCHDITEILLKVALNTINHLSKYLINVVKDWLDWNQDNVSEWSDMSSRGLLFQ